MSIALKLIVEKNSRPTMKKCKDKLESFEWREENSLYQMTLCIFCEGQSYRKVWMILKKKDVKTWIMMIS